MNERINDLASQTLAELAARGWNMNTSPFKEFTDRFAELIVRECITVMDKNNVLVENTYDDYDNGWNSAVICTINEMKQHFGVEE